MSDSPLIQYYQKAAEWIDAKPLRERALIGLSLLALVFLVWTLLIQAAPDARKKELNTQLSQLQNDQKASQDQLSVLTSAMAAGPAKVKQAEIGQLESELAQIESRLSEVGQGLIAADQLPRILQSVFEKTNGLELVEIQTLAATEMMITQVQPVETTQASSSSSASSAANAAELAVSGIIDSNAASRETKPQGSGVYKHGVVLRLRGDFFHILALIKALENLQWKFYWESLDYVVTDYPQAEIELRVFTLSSEEGLLGV
jgi:MSHA biogenesis protein MshJ